MAEYFQDMEDRDGLRWTWHMFPNKSKEKTPKAAHFAPEMVVPLACMITPLKSSPTPEIWAVPRKCKQCGALANSLCRLDFQSRFWLCPFCRTRNDLPEMQELPPEFVEGNATVEYVLPSSTRPAPSYMFILDIATTAAELNHQKEGILLALDRLPSNALVGLMTVGRHVSVWDLSTSNSKCYTFSGAPRYANYTQDIVKEVLGVKKGLAHQNKDVTIDTTVMTPIKESRAFVDAVLEDLTPDPWKNPDPSKRVVRSTGAALQIATAICELLVSGEEAKKNFGRILLFLSGPCARGPGQCVSENYDETIRTHGDIKEGLAPHLAKATEFGEAIAKRLREISFCLDVFMISLDQIGLRELTEAVLYTGGVIVSSDLFENRVFRESLVKLFDPAKNRPTVNQFYNVSLEVQTSSETKIAGCIGPCRGLGKMSSSVSEAVEVGEAGTCAWSMSATRQNTTFCIVFDAEEEGTQGGASAGGNRYFQFITAFTDCEGLKRLRVTTCCQQVAADSSRDVMNSCYAFDQLTAAVVVGRMASKYMEQSENLLSTVVRWIDRSLIRFVRKFATYVPNDASSLSLLPQYSLFPQFMYHIRRCEFLQIFNSSVDETVFFRSCLFRETVPQSVAMLQPSLLAYNYGEADPYPVLLDSESVKSDNILLCDAYFDVTIHHGSIIAEWRKMKYNEQPGYEAFDAQLKAPHAHVESLVADRFPAPKITVCDQHGSQARYLYNKINPTTAKAPGDDTDVQVIHTDDANLQTFMQKLKQLAVTADAK